jgi:hypothetical protein
MGIRREPNTTYVSAKCGLSRAYAAECHKVLESLQPEGTHLGLLELCKLARGTCDGAIEAAALKSDSAAEQAHLKLLEQSNPTSKAILEQVEGILRDVSKSIRTLSMERP